MLGRGGAAIRTASTPTGPVLVGTTQVSFQDFPPISCQDTEYDVPAGTHRSFGTSLIANAPFVNWLITVLSPM